MVAILANIWLWKIGRFCSSVYLCLYFLPCILNLVKGPCSENVVSLIFNTWFCLYIHPYTSFPPQNHTKNQHGKPYKTHGTPAGSNPGESLSPHCVKSGSIFFFFLFQLFFSLEECQVSLFEGWTEREDRNHQRATSSSSYFPAVSTLLGVSLPPASDWVTSLACLIRSGRPGLPDTATNIPHNRTCFLFYKIWRLTGEMIDQEHRERVGNPNFVVCWFK